MQTQVTDKKEITWQEFDPHTPLEIYKILAQSEIEQSIGIAQNPYTPSEIYKILASH